MHKLVISEIEWVKIDITKSVNAIKSTILKEYSKKCCLNVYLMSPNFNKIHFYPQVPHMAM